MHIFLCKHYMNKKSARFFLERLEAEHLSKTANAFVVFCKCIYQKPQMYIRYIYIILIYILQIINNIYMFLDRKNGRDDDRRRFLRSFIFVRSPQIWTRVFVRVHKVGFWVLTSPELWAIIKPTTANND